MDKLYETHYTIKQSGRALVSAHSSQEAESLFLSKPDSVIENHIKDIQTTIKPAIRSGRDNER